MVKGFSVEPGSNRSVITRLRSCAPVSRARLFGLNDGTLASASTSPVRTSSAISAPALARCCSTALLQRAEGEALDLAVDRERRGRAVLRRADRFDVLDDAAQAVLDHAPAARLAAERRLVGELDAFLAGVVDAGEADDVRGHFAGRVVAAVFALL